MVDAFPSQSLALGFWVKHQDAMEAFVYEGDEDESVPSELQGIFDDDRYRALLDRIEEVSSGEGDTLVHAVANHTAQAWAKHPSLIIERRRKAHGWCEKFFVRRKRARRGGPIEVGFYLETNAKLGMTFYTFLWTKGGKAAAEFNAQCIREFSRANVLKGSDDTTRYWSNGVILLARVPLGGFMTGDELDCKQLFEQTTDQISRCSADAVAKILEPRG